MSLSLSLIDCPSRTLEKLNELNVRVVVKVELNRERELGRELLRLVRWLVKLVVDRFDSIATLICDSYLNQSVEWLDGKRLGKACTVFSR